MYLVPWLRVTSSEFHKDRWGLKTRIPVLLCGFVRFILCAIPRLVIDGQTDRHTDTGPTVQTALVKRRADKNTSNKPILFGLSLIIPRYGDGIDHHRPVLTSLLFVMLSPLLLSVVAGGK